MNFKSLLNHVWRKPEQAATAKGSTTLADLATLHVLYYSASHRRCDSCPNESTKCRKLHFANCTICVVPNDQVVCFNRRKNSLRKPSPKI